MLAAFPAKEADQLLNAQARLEAKRRDNYENDL
jgi:hypothetical protein